MDKDSFMSREETVKDGSILLWASSRPWRRFTTENHHIKLADNIHQHNKRRCSATRTKVARLLAVSALAVVFVLVDIIDCKGGLAASAQRLTGIRVERGPDDDRLTARMFRGEAHLKEKQPYTLRVFGHNLNEDAVVRFTEQIGGEADDCDHGPQTKEYILERQNDATGLLDVLLPKPHSIESTWYLCLRSVNVSGPHFIHQGNASWLSIVVESAPSRYMLKYLPLQIGAIIVLLCLSGLFSGLNLGVMSLDLTELKLIENSGTRRERSYAKKIRPVREHGNFLLCTILFGNVLVNSCLTILLDDLTGSGLYAVATATMMIVIFGEIVPQSVCSRHGLAIGAHTILLTQFFMVLTFPLSYPISKCLDKLLGKEIGAVYNRERLLELIRLSEEHENLEQDEANIIAGALELRKKTVAEIMTPLSDVFMIPVDAILNFDCVSEIMRQGYSRVPIYDTSPDNIIALLNIKDLALVDPDDNTPVQTLCKFYNHHVYFILDDTTLDVMLETFRQGRTHLAFVQHIESNAAGDRDPEYRNVGIVTLEDVIEEIIQAEIMDESDVVSSNRRRNKRAEQLSVAGSGALSGLRHPGDATLMTPFKSDYAASLITPQLRIASFQFMSTTLEPFKHEFITPTILHRLTNHPDVAVAYRMRTDLDEHDLNSIPLLYQTGKPCDYFIIILEGRVEVKCGKEGITFQGGPFSYFGISALALGPPDEELFVRTNRAVEEAKAVAVEKADAAAVEKADFEKKQHDELTSLAMKASDGTETTKHEQIANGGLKMTEINSTTVTKTKSALKTSSSGRPSINADSNDDRTALVASEKSVHIVPEANGSLVKQQHSTADAAPSSRRVAVAGAGDVLASHVSVSGTSPVNAASTTTTSAAAAASATAGIPRKESSSDVVCVFIPDYDVKPVSDLLYMRVMRAHYLAAFRASQYERRSQDRSKSDRSAVEYLRAEFDTFAKPGSHNLQYPQSQHSSQFGASVGNLSMQHNTQPLRAAAPPGGAVGGSVTPSPHLLADADADVDCGRSASPASTSAAAGGMVNAVIGSSYDSHINSLSSSRASNAMYAAAVGAPTSPTGTKPLSSAGDGYDEIDQFLSITDINAPHATPSAGRDLPESPYATPPLIGGPFINTQHESPAAGASGDGLHGSPMPLSQPIHPGLLTMKGARAHEKVKNQGQLTEWGTVGLNELKPTKVIFAPSALDDDESSADEAKSQQQALVSNSKVAGKANSSSSSSSKSPSSRIPFSRSVTTSPVNTTTTTTASSFSPKSKLKSSFARSSSNAVGSAPTTYAKRKRSVKVVLGTDSDPELELRDVK